MGDSEMIIDEGFKRLLWSLGEEELSHLESSIKEDGCRDKLVVWQEEDVLIDGHNRYDICTRLGIDFETHCISFGCREDVENWIDRNQAGRRNATPEQLSVIRGRLQERRKKTQGSNNQHVQSKSEKPQVEAFQESKTAKSIAEEFGVSRATIERDAQRAIVYDAMLEAGDEEAAEIAIKAPQKVVSSAATRVRKAKKPTTPILKASPAKSGSRKGGVLKKHPVKNATPSGDTSPPETTEQDEIAATAEQLKAYKNRNAGPRTPEQEAAMMHSKAIKTMQAMIRAIDDLQDVRKNAVLHLKILNGLKELSGLLKGWK